MAELQIRPMQPDEIELVVGVWERSRSDAQPWLEKRMGHSHDDNLRFFCDVIAKQYEVWLAVDGGTIAGLLALGDGTVEYLYVEPSCQDRGVGTVLLNEAKRRLPGGLTLFTHQGNARARTFYERRGLVARRFGISPPPENEPDVLYGWEPDASA